MQAMRRAWVKAWVAAAVLSVGAGCEKSSKQTPAPTPTAKDARVIVQDAGPQDARVVALDARDDGPEPTVPPPPPTVKANGKGDCKVDYAPRPTRDPNPVCKITGGTFMMGSADPKAAANEKPVRKVTLTPYFIDQFEVTNAQVAHFLNAVGNRCASGRDCFFSAVGDGGLVSGAVIRNVAGHYVVDQGYERRPAADATVEGAERYCAWVGKRLPTEAEWEFAARHDPKTNKDYRWPWGDKFSPKRAACDEAVCKDGFRSTIEDETSSDEAPVGTFDGTHGFGDGSSPWGVHDMAGNVSEIMADFFTEPYQDCKACNDPTVLPPEIPEKKQDRSVRSFHTDSDSLRSTLRYGGPAFEGFRCVYR
ncbi:MAG TPA: SUMF1/EgtB/PvdO family nonheme iron enzyme [Kofleriaceae bacterium]|nr:SUMF1/EgtB/PvdO family nonheme iron enzyme [Kofleriaceae bacterium]